MIIDAHIHLNAIDDSYEKSFQKLLSDIELNGISKCFIIADNVAGSGCADTETALKFANDNIYVIGSPNILKPENNEYEKFDGFLKNRKIIGLKLFPGHDHYYANDARCNQYFDLAIKYSVPVTIHTGVNSNDDDCAKYNDPKLIVEVAKRYPDLKLIIAHYFWPRMEYCYETTRGFNNIYFDTSGMADPEVVERSGGIDKVKDILVRTINNRAESVLFGTDYPLCDTKLHIDLINSLNISNDLKTKVFSENAESLYNI